jgi:phage/plasmid-associated DNA primase
MEKEDTFEQLRSTQLLTTTVKFKDLPKEAILTRPSNELISQAIQATNDYLSNYVKENCEESEEEEEEDEDSVETAYNHKTTTEGHLSEVSMFLDGLKTNFIFDIGFRCDNKEMKLCWCPW